MFHFPRLMPLTKGLLIAIFASYVAQGIAQHWVGHALDAYFHLTTGALGWRTPIQVALYPLGRVVNAQTVLMLIVEMVFVWWAVGSWEERVGTRETGNLVAVTTIGAGLAAILASFVFAPAVVFGANVWILATLSAMGWSMRYARMVMFGQFETTGISLVWIAIALVFVNFVSIGSGTRLVADLAAVGLAIGFLEWRLRGGRVRAPKVGRSSKVVPIGAAKGKRKQKDPPQWLN